MLRFIMISAAAFLFSLVAILGLRSLGGADGRVRYQHADGKRPMTPGAQRHSGSESLAASRRGSVQSPMDRYNEAADRVSCLPDLSKVDDRALRIMNVSREELANLISANPVGAKNTGAALKSLIEKEGGQVRSCLKNARGLSQSRLLTVWTAKISAKELILSEGKMDPTDQSLQGLPAIRECMGGFLAKAHRVSALQGTDFVEYEGTIPLQFSWN